MKHPDHTARGTALLTLGLSALSLSHAQDLAPNAAAPSGQKPFVEVANGQPVVLIAEPNAAGVSRNEWDKFNVRDVLVLNNATGTVNTVTAGKIGGNPFLLIPARVILNEVTGTASSDLRGVIEVAGGRADVVVANPYGVACNGCGFVNAGRVTLTTGKGEFDASGAIKSFTPADGKVVIGEAGLNASDSEYFSIISRAVEIGGPLYGQKVEVIAGKGTVDYATLARQTASQGGPVPEFAIDVGALGSIHAGQIYLVSNDKGAGVRSEGQLYASDKIQLSADGTVKVGGQAYAAGSAEVKATGTAAVSGTLAAGGSAEVKADRVVTGAGSRMVAGLKPDGTLDPQGVLRVEAQAAELGGASVSGGTQTIAAKSVALTGEVTGQTVEVRGSEVSNAGTVSGGSVSVKAAKITNQGQVSALKADLQASGEVTNAGDLTAQDLTLRGQQVSNAGTVTAGTAGFHASGDVTNAGTISAQTATVKGSSVTNGGTLTGDSVKIQADQGVNNSGALGGGTLSVRAAEITNQGQVSALKADLQASGGVTNAGTISAQTATVKGTTVTNGGTITGEALDLRAGQQVDNSGVLAGEQLSVNTGAFKNAGTVSGGAVSVQAAEIANRGQVSALKADLHASGRLTNSGTVTGETVRLSAEAVDNAGGQVVGRSTEVTAQRLGNRGGVIAGEGGRVATGELQNARGVITAAEVQVQGDVLDNTEGVIEAARGNLQAREVRNRGGVIAGDMLSVRSDALSNEAGTLVTRQGGVSAETVRNAGGTLAAATFSVRGSLLDNAGGLISAGQADIRSGAVVNAGGVIEAQAGELHTGALDNRSGTLSGAALNITAGRVSNGAGDITTGGAFGVQALDNARGLVSAGTVTLGGGPLTNVGGALQAGHLAGSAERVDNAGGFIASGSGGLSTSSLINRGGVIETGELGVQGRADNAGGLIAVRRLTLDGPALGNAGGAILAGEATVRTGTLDNAGGTLNVGTLDARTGSLSNAGGAFVWRSGQASFSGLASNQGGVIAGDRAVFEGTRLNNAGGLLQANDLQAKVGELSNVGGVISAENAQIEAASADNSGGKMFGTQFRVQAGTLNNRGGTIGGDTVSVDARALDNSGGGSISGEGVSVQAGSLNNAGGQISGGSVKVGAGSLNNAGGLIYGSQLGVQAGSLNNGSGGVIAGEAVGVQAGSLNNAGGQVTGGSVSVNADSLNNAGGLIYGSQLGVQAGSLDNGSGGVISGEAVGVQAGSLNNTGGEITGRQLSVGAGNLNNAGGHITGEQVAVSADEMNNAGGYVQGNSVGLTVAGTLNNQGGTVEGNFTTVDVGRFSGTNSVVTGADTLRVKIRSDYTHQDQNRFTGGRELTLDVTGNLRNEGTLRTGGVLNATATGNVTNVATMVGAQLNVTGTNVYNTGPKAVMAGAGGGFHVKVAPDGRMENTGGATLFGLGHSSFSGGTLYNHSSNVRVIGNLDAEGKIINTRDYALTERTGSRQVTQDLRSESGEAGQRTFTETTRDTVATGASSAGRIVVSGDMNVSGQIRNEASLIYAGGDLRVNGRTYQGGNDPDVVNIAPENVRQTRQEGADRYASGSSGYLNETTERTAVLGPDGRPLSAVIGAGGTLYVNGNAVQNGNTAPTNLQGSGTTPALAGPAGGNAAGGAGAGGSGGAPQPGQHQTRTDEQARTLPNTPLSVTDNAMYTVSASGNGPVVTTNPDLLPAGAFTSSRDVFGDGLGRTAGDGFYEQELVTDQMLLLRPQDPRLANMDGLYAELLRNGQDAQAKLGFTPGVPLTPEQMARLDRDVVLMEPQTIQTEGGPVTALVPRVYLAPGGQAGLTGSVMTGSRVQMQLRGDFANDSQVYAGSVAQISAYDINNRLGEIQAGQAAFLQAGRDVNNVGGSVRAGLVDVRAGRDILAETLTRQYGADSRYGRLTNTELQAAGFYGDDVRLDAGQDINFKGAQVVAGRAQLTAGRDVNLNGVRRVQSNGTLNADGSRSSIQTDLGMGSVIAADQTRVRAGRDLTTEGAQFTGTPDADGHSTTASLVQLGAGRDINLNEIRHSQTSVQEGSVTRRGFLGLSKTTTNYKVTTDLDLAQGTVINAHTVTGHADGNLTTRGLQVVGTSEDQVQLTANGKVRLGNAQNHSRTEQHLDVTRSGFGVTFDRGIGIRLGRDSVNSTTTTEATQQVGTHIEARNILIQGKQGTIREGGSVVRMQGSGVIQIGADGQKIEERAAYNTANTTSTVSSSNTGLTIGVRSDLIGAGTQMVNSALRLSGKALPTSRDTPQGADLPPGFQLGTELFGSGVPRVEESTAPSAPQGPRTDELKFALTTNVLRSGYDLYQAGAQAEKLRAAGNANPTGTSVGLWLDHSRNTQTTEQSVRQALGSVTEGKEGTVIYRTVGDPAQAGMVFEGSKIQGKRVVLQASGTIDARSAVSEARSTTSSSGFSAGLGVSATFGSNGAGVGVDVEAGGQKNEVTTWERTHQNTLIDGQEVSVRADTVNLHGANIFADDLDFEARRLSIVSQQDSAGVSGKGWTFGISASVPVVGAAAPRFGVSGQYGDQGGDFLGVGTLSGIQAGRARIDVKEGELVGGFITTTGDPGQSTITGHFVQRDLQNSSTYRNRSFGGSFSTGSFPRLSLGMTSPQREQGVTRSNITGTVNGTAQTGSPVTLDREAVLAAHNGGQPSTAEGQPSLSKFKAQPAEMAEKQEAAAMFGADASKTVGDITKAKTRKYTLAQVAEGRALELLNDPKATPQQREQAQQALQAARSTLAQEQATYDAFRDGGPAKIALHALIGGATAKLGGGNPWQGAGSAAIVEASRPVSAKLTADLTPEQAAFVQQLASAFVGGVTGGVQGAGIGITTELNNRQLHPTEIDTINKYAKQYRDRVNASGACRTDRSKCITEDEAKSILGWAALNKVDKVWHQRLGALETGKGRMAELYRRLNGDAYAWLSDKAQRNDWTLGSGQRLFTATEQQYNNERIFLSSRFYESARDASRGDNAFNRDLVDAASSLGRPQSFYSKHLSLSQTGTGSVSQSVKTVGKETYEGFKALVNLATSPEKWSQVPAGVRQSVQNALKAGQDCAGNSEDCLALAYIHYLQETPQDRMDMQLRVATSLMGEGIGAGAKGAVAGAKGATAAARTGSMERAAANTVRRAETGAAQGTRTSATTTASRVGANCIRPNSFDALTPVWTVNGLIPIVKLQVGDLVLGYNEATGQNGYYPITALHRHLDPELTFLWVKSNSGAKELIETTPEHPFYLAQNVDGSLRPTPQGHEELNRNWVGAGHLKIGDKLRLASGELGEVTALNTVQQARMMYNLTVSEAHTFYVGQNGWLVHNGGGCPIWSLDPKRGLGNAQNAMKHWKAHGSEFPEYSNASEYVKGAQDFLRNMPKDAVTKVRADGSIVVYQPSTEKFGLYMADGTPRTFMKIDVAGFHPNSGIKTGMDYFNAQK